MEAQNVHGSHPSISIPVIDLSGIESPSERPRIVDQVKYAAKTLGFFQFINHGIPLSVQNTTVEAVEAFHELPKNEKSRYSNPSGVMSVASCQRDTFWIMASPEMPPEEDIPAVLRREIGEWVPRAVIVAEALMEVFSEGLGLEKGRLGELSLLGNKLFLGHRYPNCPDPDRMAGFASHTDGGVLTVLMQNCRSGLQVMHEGSWLDIKPELGALVVNIGDFFQILSNDEYKSVQHRVLANTCKGPRISVAMVFNPSKWNGNGYFGPLPELLSLEKPAIYRRFTKEEHIYTFDGNDLGNKSLVERVKISLS